MSTKVTPVCDRCGKEGVPGQEYAQVKVVHPRGLVQVQDLCPECEKGLGDWMTDERGNDNGTD